MDIKVILAQVDAAANHVNKQPRYLQPGMLRALYEGAHGADKMLVVDRILDILKAHCEGELAAVSALERQRRENQGLTVKLEAITRERDQLRSDAKRQRGTSVASAFLGKF